jgi:hypothetical protein
VAKMLKVLQTSLGFFDQAIAAPSMKAALQAWDADSNRFYQGACCRQAPGKLLSSPISISAATGRYHEAGRDELRSGGGRDFWRMVQPKPLGDPWFLGGR